MLFFLTGIAGALILLVDMLVTDRRKRRQAVRAAAQRQNGGS
jgi:hypothetical protein